MAEAYASIGTSTPIFVPSAFSSEPVRLGADYFAIRICAAQVAFVGSIWSKVRSVLVSTQVNLHHATLEGRYLHAFLDIVEVDLICHELSPRFFRV